MKIIKLVFIFVFFVLALSRCEKDGDEFSTNLETTYFVEEFISLGYDQDIDQLVDDAFYDNFSSSRFSPSSSDPKKKFKDDKYGKCATIELDEINKIKIISFDGECKGKNGQIRKGKIIIKYSKIKGQIGSFRQLEFDNFYINEVLIEGIRKHEVVNIDDNGNKTFHMSFNDGKMTYPDGSFSTKSKSITKYVLYENKKRVSTTITGGANGINSNGKLYLMEITTPIVFLSQCSEDLIHNKGKIPTSGVKKIKKGNQEMIVDFGDGECDFKAEVSKNGITEIIDLKKIQRKRKFKKLKP